MNLDGVRLTVDDLRELHCSRGIRRWFESNNLDFKAFLKDGIEAKTLYETGDALALRIIERKLNGR